MIPEPERAARAPHAAPSLADEVVDRLVPEGLDWRRVVREHPLASVAVVAGVGFLVGRSRGRAMLAALSAYAVGAISDGVNDALGEDLL